MTLSKYIMMVYIFIKCNIIAHLQNLFSEVSNYNTQFVCEIQSIILKIVSNINFVKPLNRLSYLRIMPTCLFFIIKMIIKYILHKLSNHLIL